MRIAVIGAGAIGGTVAALLDRADHEVTVTARGAHLAAIRERGLQLRGAWGEHLAHVRALEALDAAPELAIVAVKVADTRAAIAANVAHLRGIPVVVIQNGIEGIATAAAAAPDADVIGGLSLIAASFLTPGEVTVTVGLPTMLGRRAGADRRPLLLAAAVLGEVMPIETVADFEAAQWTKLMINQVNALPAITGRSVQEVVADARLRRVLTASMRETAGVARRAGRRFAPLGALTPGIVALVERAPLAIGQLVPWLMARRMGAVPNPGSTLQSIRRGLPTEVDALNGAVARVAAEHGGSAPINAALTALVHEVETGSGFLTTEQVLARVPLR